MPDALIYEKQIRNGATHAIVIGVGHYLYLPGGSGAKKLRNTGMTQLKSPPQSAETIAKWLIENYEHPRKPLASVSLLMSDTGNSNITYSKGRSVTRQVASASMQDVKPAIEAWRNRGHQHKDNLLLFFFCGHGISLGADLSLLLADFGANPLSPSDGAIDFRGLWRGMDECVAREQCYFIDACRVGDDQLVQSQSALGAPIIQNTVTINRTGDVRRAPVFYSTLGGTSAFAKAGKPTIYTEALLEAFGGAGSGDEDGSWQVRTVLLHDALGRLVADASRRLQIPQSQIPSSDDLTGIPLNVLPAPRIPVIVSCKPDKHTATATFSCENQSIKKQRGPRKESWRLSLPVDDYDFSAKVKSKRYSKKKFSVRPTFRTVEIEIE